MEPFSGRPPRPPRQHHSGEGGSGLSFQRPSSPSPKQESHHKGCCCSTEGDGGAALGAGSPHPARPSTTFSASTDRRSPLAQSNGITASHSLSQPPSRVQPPPVRLPGSASLSSASTGAAKTSEPTRQTAAAARRAPEEAAMATAAGIAASLNAARAPGGAAPCDGFALSSGDSRPEARHTALRLKSQRVLQPPQPEDPSSPSSSLRKASRDAAERTARVKERPAGVLPNGNVVHLLSQSHSGSDNNISYFDKTSLTPPSSSNGLGEGGGRLGTPSRTINGRPPSGRLGQRSGGGYVPSSYSRIWTSGILRGSSSRGDSSYGGRPRPMRLEATRHSSMGPENQAATATVMAEHNASPGSSRGPSPTNETGGTSNCSVPFQSATNTSTEDAVGGPELSLAAQLAAEGTAPSAARRPITYRPHNSKRERDVLRYYHDRHELEKLMQAMTEEDPQAVPGALPLTSRPSSAAVVSEMWSRSGSTVAADPFGGSAFYADRVLRSGTVGPTTSSAFHALDRESVSAGGSPCADGLHSGRPHTSPSMGAAHSYRPPDQGSFHRLQTPPVPEVVAHHSSGALATAGDLGDHEMFDEAAQRLSIGSVPLSGSSGRLHHRCPRRPGAPYTIPVKTLGGVLTRNPQPVANLNSSGTLDTFASTAQRSENPSLDPTSSRAAAHHRPPEPNSTHSSHTALPSAPASQMLPRGTEGMISSHSRQVTLVHHQQEEGGQRRLDKQRAFALRHDIRAFERRYRRRRGVLTTQRVDQLMRRVAAEHFCKREGVFVQRVGNPNLEAEEALTGAMAPQEGRKILDGALSVQQRESRRKKMELQFDILGTSDEDDSWYSEEEEEREDAELSPFTATAQRDREERHRTAPGAFPVLASVKPHDPSRSRDGGGDSGETPNSQEELVSCVSEEQETDFWGVIPGGRKLQRRHGNRRASEETASPPNRLAEGRTPGVGTENAGNQRMLSHVPLTPPAKGMHHGTVAKGKVSDHLLRSEVVKAVSKIQLAHFAIGKDNSLPQQRPPPSTAALGARIVGGLNPASPSSSSGHCPASPCRRGPSCSADGGAPASSGGDDMTTRGGKTMSSIAASGNCTHNSAAGQQQQQHSTAPESTTGSPPNVSATVTTAGGTGHNMNVPPSVPGESGATAAPFPPHLVLPPTPYSASTAVPALTGTTRSETNTTITSFGASPLPDDHPFLLVDLPDSTGSPVYGSVNHYSPDTSRTHVGTGSPGGLTSESSPDTSTRRAREPHNDLTGAYNIPLPKRLGKCLLQHKPLHRCVRAASRLANFVLMRTLPKALYVGNPEDFELLLKEEEEMLMESIQAELLKSLEVAAAASRVSPSSTQMDGGSSPESNTASLSSPGGPLSALHLRHSASSPSSRFLQLCGALTSPSRRKAARKLSGEDDEDDTLSIDSEDEKARQAKENADIFEELDMTSPETRHQSRPTPLTRVTSSSSEDERREIHITSGQVQLMTTAGLDQTVRSGLSASGPHGGGISVRQVDCLDFEALDEEVDRRERLATNRPFSRGAVPGEDDNHLLVEGRLAGRESHYIQLQSEETPFNPDHPTASQLNRNPNSSATLRRGNSPGGKGKEVERVMRDPTGDDDSIGPRPATRSGGRPPRAASASRGVAASTTPNESYLAPSVPLSSEQDRLGERHNNSNASLGLGVLVSGARGSSAKEQHRRKLVMSKGDKKFGLSAHRGSHSSTLGSASALFGSSTSPKVDREKAAWGTVGAVRRPFSKAIPYPPPQSPVKHGRPPVAAAAPQGTSGGAAGAALRALIGRSTATLCQTVLALYRSVEALPNPHTGATGGSLQGSEMASASGTSISAASPPNANSTTRGAVLGTNNWVFSRAALQGGTGGSVSGASLTLSSFLPPLPTDVEELLKHYATHIPRTGPEPCLTDAERHRIKAFLAECMFSGTVPPLPPVLEILFTMLEHKDVVMVDSKERPLALSPLLVMSHGGYGLAPFSGEQYKFLLKHRDQVDRISRALQSAELNTGLDGKISYRPLLIERLIRPGHSILPLSPLMLALRYCVRHNSALRYEEAKCFLGSIELRLMVDLMESFAELSNSFSHRHESVMTERELRRQKEEIAAAVESAAYHSGNPVLSRENSPNRVSGGTTNTEGEFTDLFFEIYHETLLDWSCVIICEAAIGYAMDLAGPGLANFKLPSYESTAILTEDQIDEILGSSILESSLPNIPFSHHNPQVAFSVVEKNRSVVLESLVRLKGELYFLLTGLDHRHNLLEAHHKLLSVVKAGSLRRQQNRVIQRKVLPTDATHSRTLGEELSWNNNHNNSGAGGGPGSLTNGDGGSRGRSPGRVQVHDTPNKEGSLSPAPTHTRTHSGHLPGEKNTSMAAPAYAFGSPTTTTTHHHHHHHHHSGGVPESVKSSVKSNGLSVFHSSKHGTGIHHTTLEAMAQAIEEVTSGLQCTPLQLVLLSLPMRGNRPRNKLSDESASSSEDEAAHPPVLNTARPPPTPTAAVGSPSQKAMASRHLLQRSSRMYSSMGSPLTVAHTNAHPEKIDHHSDNTTTNGLNETNTFVGEEVVATSSASDARNPARNLLQPSGTWLQSLTSTIGSVGSPLRGASRFFPEGSLCGCVVAGSPLDPHELGNKEWSSAASPPGSTRDGNQGAAQPRPHSQARGGGSSGPNCEVLPSRAVSQQPVGIHTTHSFSSFGLRQQLEVNHMGRRQWPPQDPIMTTLVKHLQMMEDNRAAQNRTNVLLTGEFYEEGCPWSTGSESNPTVVDRKAAEEAAGTAAKLQQSLERMAQGGGIYPVASPHGHHPYGGSHSALRPHSTSISALNMTASNLMAAAGSTPGGASGRAPHTMNYGGNATNSTMSAVVVAAMARRNTIGDTIGVPSPQPQNKWDQPLVEEYFNSKPHLEVTGSGQPTASNAAQLLRSQGDKSTGFTSFKDEDAEADVWDFALTVEAPLMDPPGTMTPAMRRRRQKLPATGQYPKDLIARFSVFVDDTLGGGTGPDGKQRIDHEKKDREDEARWVRDGGGIFRSENAKRRRCQQKGLHPPLLESTSTPHPRDSTASASNTTVASTSDGGVADHHGVVRGTTSAGEESFEVYIRGDLDLRGDATDRARARMAQERKHEEASTLGGIQPHLPDKPRRKVVRHHKPVEVDARAKSKAEENKTKKKKPKPAGEGDRQPWYTHGEESFNHQRLIAKLKRARPNDRFDLHAVSPLIALKTCVETRDIEPLPQSAPDVHGGRHGALDLLGSEWRASADATPSAPSGPGGGERHTHRLTSSAPSAASLATTAAEAPPSHASGAGQQSPTSPRRSQCSEPLPPEAPTFDVQTFRQTNPFVATSPMFLSDIRRTKEQLLARHAAVSKASRAPGQKRKALVLPPTTQNVVSSSNAKLSLRQRGLRFKKVMLPWSKSSANQPLQGELYKM